MNQFTSINLNLPECAMHGGTFYLDVQGMVGGQLIQLNALIADDARLEVAHHVEVVSDLFVCLFACLFDERNVCLPL